MSTKSILDQRALSVVGEPYAFESRAQKASIKSRKVHVTQEHVHKANDINRLLSWIEFDRDLEGVDTFQGHVRVVPDHPYFFEHDRRHVPGLYIIEAGRQLGLAVPHLFFGVGYNYGFVLEACDMSFTGFANLKDDLIIKAHVFNQIERKGKLQSISFDGTFYQNGEALVRYKSHIRLIHERLLKRYERQSL